MTTKYSPILWWPPKKYPQNLHTQNLKTPPKIEIQNLNPKKWPEPMYVWKLGLLLPIVGVCNCFMFCCTLLYVPSSFAIILMGKKELVALLSLSSWCLVNVVWLFRTSPWVCLQFVIVVFPDHNHLLLLTCLQHCLIYSSLRKKTRLQHILI